MIKSSDQLDKKNMHIFFPFPHPPFDIFDGAAHTPPHTEKNKTKQNKERNKAAKKMFLSLIRRIDLKTNKTN